MKRRLPLRLFLLALFVYAGAYQARYSVGAIRGLLEREEKPRAPFTLAHLSAVIESVEPEAARAGLHPGDHLLSVEGDPYTGLADLAAPLGKARVGDTFIVKVNGGQKIRIHLAPSEEGRAGIAEWSVVAVLDVAMPILCLLLGFWVAVLRMEDPIAWLLLALLLSFSHITRDYVAHWEGWARTAGLHYHSILVTTWSIWMMLFGIYFPDRFALDRRLPWIKWILITLLVVYGAVQTVIAVGTYEEFKAVSGLDALVSPFAAPARVVEMLAISLYFVILGAKLRTTRDPDARRRLVLLHVGTALSLLPAFLLALRSLALHVDMFSGAPEGVLIPSLLMMFLFPLTLAYVIVVHRALDVRVVIRQGFQYALARRGVMVLQGVTVLTAVGVMILLVSGPRTRPAHVAMVLAAGLLFIILLGRVGERLRKWIDRRFFREAYNAERILSELSAQVRTMVRTGPLLETVARRISESLHIPRVTVFVEEGGAYRPAHALGYDGLPDARLEEGSPTVALLIRTGAAVRVPFDDPKRGDGSQDPGGGEMQMLRALGIEVLLPLMANEKLPGIIGLGPKLSEEPYSGADFRLLQSVATQTGLALENSRLTAAIASEVAQRELLNREMEIAREVQERLFPQVLPSVEGLDCAGACRPALGVGGDYYDFLALREGRLGIAIGDVSGKGIGAALLMASLQASLRGQTIIEGTSLAGMIANVNRLVYDASPDNRYATFFYAQYDPRTRELAYVNAGHCPPILLRRGNGRLEIIRLKEGGAVVGLFPDSTYAEGSVRLQPGDVMVAYTDGISEALNAGEEEWGEENLIAAAAALAGRDAAGTIERLMREADLFAAGAPQHDDMTLVVVRVL